MDNEMREMIGERRSLFFRFPHQSFVGEGDVADESSDGRKGFELGEAQNVGRLVDLPPFAVEDTLVRVVGQEDRDLGDARDLGPRLLQCLADGGFGERFETIRPVAGFGRDRDRERRAGGAQRALSSLAVAPS